MRTGELWRINSMWVEKHWRLLPVSPPHPSSFKLTITSEPEELWAIIPRAQKSLWLYQARGSEDWGARRSTGASFLSHAFDATLLGGSKTFFWRFYTRMFAPDTQVACKNVLQTFPGTLLRPQVSAIQVCYNIPPVCKFMRLRQGLHCTLEARKSWDSFLLSVACHSRPW